MYRLHRLHVYLKECIAVAGGGESFSPNLLWLKFDVSCITIFRSLS